MPMFIKRLIVLGASLVCSVDSTRCRSGRLDGDFGRLEVTDFRRRE